MKKLVLASGNPDKLRELRSLLEDMSFEVVSILEILPDWSVEETGITLEENALLKARDVAERTGEASIADDTGLFVDVLGGAPGIYAARFCGSECTYEDNVRKLLRIMLYETNRKASFRTAAAFVSPFGEELCEMGEVQGIILEEADGDGGFGYDPVFLPNELDRTFARCSPEEKHRISHRARALGRLIEKLESSKF